MNKQMLADEFGSFGDWLRRRRKALDLTQAQLAQRTGCTAATIRKIEAAERKPSQQLAKLLAAALHVPDDDHAIFLQAARQMQAVVNLLPAPGLPVVASSSHGSPHNLPAPVTSLVGRLRDADNVAHLLTRPDVRLLTLLGPPGIGKTRLGLHTAETVAGHFRDGVWFVDLAPLTDATLVLPAIAYVLSVAEVGVTSLLQRLWALLADKELLLVLDNFEQVSAAALDVATLLRASKGLKVLVTSRTPLHLAGEHEYMLRPLSLPPDDMAPEPLEPEGLMAYEAVQLFVARVRQQQYEFAVTPANAGSIANICVRLGGIPLALELAAAALRRITVIQLATMLSEQADWLHELQSMARDLPPRQRTLSHAIAWSYSLLDANVQTIFRQLGVFVSGFTAEAAWAVCGADPATLAFLTDHSLLARAPERWGMLEVIREFALAQMSSEERRAAQQRHTDYFAAQTNTDPYAIAREHDNYRAAMTRAIAAQDAHAALTLLIRLSWFWETHGLLREGTNLAHAALAMPDRVDERLRLDALERAAILSWQVHQFDDAMHFAEQATALARSNGRPEQLAFSLNLMGRIFIEQGDYPRAEAMLQECLHFARQIPHLYSPGCPLAHLGELALARGDWEAGQAQLAQAITFLTDAATTMTVEEEQFRIHIHVAIAHTDLAEIALAQGNVAQASHALRQVLPYARLYMRRLHCLLVTLAGFLLTSVHTTQAAEAQAAAGFLGAAAGLSERTGDVLSPFHQALITQRTAHAQQLLSQGEWQAAWRVGYTWTQAQAVTEAEKWLPMNYGIGAA